MKRNLNNEGSEVLVSIPCRGNIFFFCVHSLDERESAALSYATQLNTYNIWRKVGNGSILMGIL